MSRLPHPQGGLSQGIEPHPEAQFLVDIFQDVEGRDGRKGPVAPQDLVIEPLEVETHHQIGASQLLY